MNNDSQTIARVVAQYRGKYRVSEAGQEYWAEITGKLNYNAASQADYPVVGDLVKIVALDDEQAIIIEILARKSILQRKAAGKNEAQPIAANIDYAFIVQAVDRDFNLNRLERYLALCTAAKIKPIFVLNKTDLVSKQELADKLAQVKERFASLEMLSTSLLADKGIAALREKIKKDRVYCFVGSSGVGKSSLINKLLGQELQKTKNISTATNKGRHVTTHRELFTLPSGGLLIDSPGMREVGLVEAGAGVDLVFADINRLGEQCKFANCQHLHEPGCAVLAAVKQGKISEDQYQSFLKLRKEANYYAMTGLEKRRKDKNFGKMVKSVLKQQKKHKGGPI